MGKTIKLGLLGSGTVGSGVVKVLEMNRREITERVGRPLELKKVLVRDTGKKRPFLEGKGIEITDDINAILFLRRHIIHIIIIIRLLHISFTVCLPE